MSGIREELLKTDKHNVKVRIFRGGTIEDMEDNIKPILKREPDYNKDKDFDDCISNVSKNDSLTSNFENNSETSVFETLKNIKNKNANRITIAQLNINSIRNKFDFLKEMVCDNVDILLITETKIDSSFPIAQFQIDGYTTPYRLDRDENGGGILLYVRDDIPSKTIENLDFGSQTEAIFVEIKIGKVK